MPDVQAALPATLIGWTVLDLGGFNGRMAQWCLDRGAAAATMVDNAECLQYGWKPPGVPGDSRVRFVAGDLHEWQEPADLVICSNVIYHVKDPLAALQHIRTLTRKALVLQTSFASDNEQAHIWDGWRWYPDGDGHPNGTVWCRPTLAGLRDYLLRAGFVTTDWEQVEGDHVVVRCPI